MRDVGRGDEVLVDAADEGRHTPGDEPLWNESWYFDFCAPDGSIGGWVRLDLYPNLGLSWYHALVCGPGRPTVAVADLEAPLPRPPGLELRAHGLWAEHLGTHPLVRWQVANEAFGVAVDDPAELYRHDGPRGDRVPLGLDLEWETDGSPYHDGHTTGYEIPCIVHGEVLVGDERFELDGHGQRHHSWGVRDWWRSGWVWTSGRLDDGTRFHGAVVADGQLDGDGFATAASASIAGLDLAIEPLAWAPALLVGPDGQMGRLPRALCRFTASDGRQGLGWTEWNQPGAPGGA